MDRTETRFFFLADEHANKYGFRLTEPMPFDEALNAYKLLFAKYPGKKKLVYVPKAAVEVSVADDKLHPEIVKEFDAAMGSA
ncbi:MAG: hypothetical protein ACE14M_01930 [Terriglobales bacterium]